jgi:hypothetical protein
VDLHPRGLSEVGSFGVKPVQARFDQIVPKRGPGDQEIAPVQDDQGCGEEEVEVDDGLAFLGRCG